jgi:hypothetical protein
MTIKSTKIAAILTAALSLAAPLALGATSADAQSMYGRGTQNGNGDSHYTTPVSYRDNGGNFNDRNRAPAPRMEMRPAMPHFGYRWHQGNWNFQRGHWVWVSGFWNAR